MKLLYPIAVMLLIVSGLDYLHHGFCWQNVSFLIIALVSIVILIIKNPKQNG